MVEVHASLGFNSYFGAAALEFGVADVADAFVVAWFYCLLVGYMFLDGWIGRDYSSIRMKKMNTNRTKAPTKPESRSHRHRDREYSG